MHVSLQLRSRLTFEDLLLETLLSISVHPGPNLQVLPSPAARTATKEQPSENDRSSRGLIQAENSGKCGRLVALEVLQTERE